MRSRNGPICGRRSRSGQESNMVDKRVILLCTVLLLLLVIQRLNVITIEECTTIYYQLRQMMCQLALFNGHKHRRRTINARRPRRFWMRPGRTTAWWDHFVAGVVVEEQCKENFRMSKTRFLHLSGELCECIQKEAVSCVN